MTPLEHRLAEAAITRADVLLGEIGYSIQPGTPLHWILRRAKEESAAALVALMDADPAEPETVRKLQNDVRRYADLVRFMVETITDGEEYHQLLADEDRQELLGLMGEAARAASYEEEG